MKKATTLLLGLLLCGATSLFAQPTIDGDLSDSQYLSLGTRANTNNGFSGDGEVRELVYYPDYANSRLYIGLKSKLSTSSSNGIALFLNTSGETGASSGTELGFNGAGHYIDGQSGGANDNFKADFEVDYLFAFNSGSASSNVYFDAATKVSSDAAKYQGSADQSGTSSTNSNDDGTVFAQNSVSFAFNNGGGSDQGLEMYIPFSELGLSNSKVDVIQMFAVIVSETGFFSDETVPGNVTTGNPGFNADFSTLSGGDYATENYVTGGAQLTGSAGYRLLSTPVEVSYSSFLSPIWTQGATTGADATNGDPNVFTWSTSATDSSSANWSGLTDLSGTITKGTGFMAYVYADDDFNGSADAFPKTLSVSGTETSGSVSPTLNGNTDGFTLVGNPYASTIDFDNLSLSNVYSNAYIWNPNASSWETWNGSTGDITDGLITPFQGFFVKTSAASPSLTIEEADKSTGGSFYGKQVANMVENLRLEVAGNGLTNSTWIEFSEEGALNTSTKDVEKLAPYVHPDRPDYLQVSSRKADALLDIASLPSEMDEPITLPVEISATKAGTYTISVTDFNLSDDKTLIFYDYKTGFSATINENFAYSFELDAPAQKRTATALLAGPIEAQSTETGRFGIKIDPAVINSNEEDVTPQAFSLEQNYPNPFNPSTTIEYSVDKAGAVNLSVYNLMGQKVAELVNEAKSAGSYKVQWNAAGAASGMYYYRLDANGVSITRKMTLIK